jgi:hypothetical protein
MTKKQGIMQSTQYKEVVFYRTQKDDHISLEKLNVFNSTESNNSSQTRCLGTVATNVLIYTGKRKSETDLRKGMKILEELLKIEKHKKYLSHMRSHPKKRNKKQQKDIL